MGRAIVMLQRLGDPVRARCRAERAAGAGHQDQVGVGAEQADYERRVDFAKAAGDDGESVTVGGEAAEGDWGGGGCADVREQGLGFFGERGKDEEVGHACYLTPCPFVSSEVETGWRGAMHPSTSLGTNGLGLRQTVAPAEAGAAIGLRSRAGQGR